MLASVVSCGIRKSLLFESKILVRMTTSVVRAFLFVMANENFTGRTVAIIPHAVVA